MQLQSEVSWGWIHRKVQRGSKSKMVHSCCWLGSSTELLTGLPICSLFICLKLLTAVAFKASPRTGPASLSLCSVDHSSHRPDQVQGGWRYRLHGGGGLYACSNREETDGHDRLPVQIWVQWHFQSMGKWPWPLFLALFKLLSNPPSSLHLSPPLPLRGWWPHLPSFCYSIIVAYSLRLFQKTR